MKITVGLDTPNQITPRIAQPTEGKLLSSKSRRCSSTARKVGEPRAASASSTASDHRHRYRRGNAGEADRRGDKAAPGRTEIEPRRRQYQAGLAARRTAGPSPSTTSPGSPAAPRLPPMRAASPDRASVQARRYLRSSRRCNGRNTKTSAHATNNRMKRMTAKIVSVSNSCRATLSR